MILNHQNAIIEPLKVGGSAMARDYSKEYQREKDQSKRIVVKVKPQVFDALHAKCEEKATSPNAVLKACVEAYLLDNLYIDSNGNPKTK